MLIREFPELGYVVFATPYENEMPATSVRFTAYKADESETIAELKNRITIETQATVTGGIKWDGCANWHFPECVHFCGQRQAENFSKLFPALYAWAKELMQGNADLG